MDIRRAERMASGGPSHGVAIDRAGQSSEAPPAVPPAIVVDGVTKRFGPVIAVNQVSFDVGQAEIVALVGPSGGGKTTLLRLIAGFERPNEGTIHVAGRMIAGRGTHVPPERRGVGMVFQDYALFPHLSVTENVGFGLRGISRMHYSVRIGELLELVGLDRYGARYPHELSGGQQQRVALARALAPRPAVVLLDEPFGNLDADLRERMRTEVVAILDTERTTAIFVTHDQLEALSIADRVGVLNEGRLEQLDRPEVIFHRPATRFVADFVGRADFVPGQVLGGQISTAIGDFPNSHGHRAGTRVELMIRPHTVLFEASENGNGVVQARRFLGSRCLYELRLDSGLRIGAVGSSLRMLDPGTRVRVTADPSDVVAFDRQESAAETSPTVPPEAGLRGVD